jgi:hypothetical protein
MRDDTKRPNRRSFLRMVGGGLAVGGGAATTGCFSTLPPLGGDIDFGRVDPPSTADATYRAWIPDPTAFAGVDDEGPHDYYATVVRPTAFPGGPRGPTVHANYAAHRQCRLDHFGVPWGDYRAVVDYFPKGSAQEPLFLVKAEFDAAAVGATLSATGYERATPVDGFETYDWPDGQRVVAVGDSTLVFATGPHARDHARTVVDVVRGRVRPYHAADETFDRLSSWAGAGPLTEFSVPTFDLAEEVDATRRVRSIRPSGDAAYVALGLAFPDGETPTKKRLRRTYSSVATQENVSMEVTVEDGLGLVERRQPRRSFLKATTMRDGGEIRWPQTTWRTQFDRDAETVTFTHRGGDPVHAANARAVLYTDGLDEERDSQFADHTATVTRGDSLTVDVSDRENGDVLGLGYFVYGIGGLPLAQVAFGGDR